LSQLPSESHTSTEPNGAQGPDGHRYVSDPNTARTGTCQPRLCTTHSALATVPVLCTSPRPGVKGVTQPIAQEIDAQHIENNG
jgi:hypothetical protein